jgi:hypothetical protein
MEDFIFKRANVSKDNEMIYTRRLCLVVGLVFIIFGIIKFFME